MSAVHLFLKYWLPVVTMALVIFSASTDSMSAQRTSRFIGPVLRWFIPDISDQAVSQVQTVVRKTAHMVEYGLLSFLLWRAQRRPRPNDDRPWNTRIAVVSVVVSFLYAASDEWHQSFVPSRGAQFSDVLLDTAGAVLGMVLVWGWGRFWKRW